MIPLIAVQLAGLGLLILLSAFFSSSEMALFYLDPLEVRRIAESHPARAAQIDRIRARPTHFLSTILIGNTFVNVAVAALVYAMVERWSPVRIQEFLQAPDHLLGTTLVGTNFFHAVASVLAVSRALDNIYFAVRSKRMVRTCMRMGAVLSLLPGTSGLGVQPTSDRAQASGQRRAAPGAHAPRQIRRPTGCPAAMRISGRR